MGFSKVKVHKAVVPQSKVKAEAGGAAAGHRQNMGSGPSIMMGLKTAGSTGFPTLQKFTQILA